MKNCDVAIVGAGPYGLSIAAHLSAMGVDFRIFGSPMEFWLNHMPKGMHLKSEGFASCLYDPESAFTLESYCKQAGLPYAPMGSPVPLEVFSSYGLEFQKRFAPQLECEKVVMVQRSAGGFQVTLSNGEVFEARRVVVAVGLTYYKHMPSELSALPKEYVTHSSAHSDVDSFKGKEVAIVGAGASAIDLAALLHQAGARVQVIARVPKIRFHDPPDNLEPSWFDRLRNTHHRHWWRMEALSLRQPARDLPAHASELSRGKSPPDSRARAMLVYQGADYWESGIAPGLLHRLRLSEERSRQHSTQGWIRRNENADRRSLDRGDRL